MIKRFMGLFITVKDHQLKTLVQNTYQSVRVVGRGTIRIDPGEVRRTPEFQKALAQAKIIVDNHRSNNV